MRLGALVGPNGAGKSTLLSLMAGSPRPSGGEVTLGGKPLADYPLDGLARHRAVMRQSSSLAFDFTAAEVLAMGWILGKQHPGFEPAFNAIARRCDVNHVLERPYNALSGGEQQRLQFARAALQIWADDVADEARFLLLDEPTSNLDVANELSVLGEARRLSRTGVGVLAVVHDLNLAARYADRVAILRNGCLVALGAPEEVLLDEQLSDVYQTPILVEQNQTLNRLVIHTA